jgi:hypothetical protein
VTLRYAAQSQNIFAAVLNMNTIHISGGSQGTGGMAPNIDFYLLLDDSPSMGIAATPGCYGQSGRRGQLYPRPKPGRDLAHRPAEPGGAEPDGHRAVH